MRDTRYITFMHAAADICESHASADYRRKARRLRTVYAGRPGQLYRRLAELAQVPPVLPPAESSRATHSGEGTGGTYNSASLFGVAWAGTPARAFAQSAPALAYATPDVNAFAHLAFLEFEGPILRYSRRLALLKMAEQMHIGRFEANLIIALIQHRLNTGGIEPVASIESIPANSSFPRFLFLLTTFALLQSAIIWGIWHVFA